MNVLKVIIVCCETFCKFSNSLVIILIYPRFYIMCSQFRSPINYLMYWGMFTLNDYLVFEVSQDWVCGTPVSVFMNLPQYSSVSTQVRYSGRSPFARLT
jgi:hypothetical protein